MVKKKKNCSNVKGYSCGSTCINKTYKCNVENLTSNSKATANKITKVINVVNKQTKPNHKPFEDEDQALEEHNKVDHSFEGYSKMGINNPDDTYEALENYTSENSTSVKKADAGVLDDDGGEDFDSLEEAMEAVKLVNEFIDKAPPFKGIIYSGFKRDMNDVYGVDKLKVGSEFSFPSITSFSSDEDVADEFNEGGMFIIKNNASGSSIMGLSEYEEEMEVLVPKKAKYKVVDIDTTNFDTIFTLEEI